jgi:RNA-binding protein
MALSGKQRRTLRALGHQLKPVILVGQAGITPAVVNATVQALHDHELIKIKLQETDRIARAEAALQLATQTGAELAQSLGRTVLLFKARPEDSMIHLDGEPRASARPPRAPAASGGPGQNTGAGIRRSPSGRGPGPRRSPRSRR